MERSVAVDGSRHAPSARSGSHLPQKPLGEVEQIRAQRDSFRPTGCAQRRMTQDDNTGSVPEFITVSQEDKALIMTRFLNTLSG